MSKSLRLHSLALALACAPALATAQQTMKSALWWNASESGWGMFTIDQGSVIAPGWFTYDTDGEPVWFLVPGAAPQPDGSYKGDILKFTGVPFAQIAGSAADPATRVGEATVRFTDDKSMSFSYTIGNVTQTKQMTRFPFGAKDLVCKATSGSRASASNYSDLWSSPGSSGWGLQISHVDNDLYATWYTYDGDREAMFYVGATARQPDGSFTGTLVKQRNGTPYPQIAGQRPSPGSDPVGTATFRFTDGENGTFSYTVGNVTQSKPIRRSQFGSTTSVCEVVPYQTGGNGGGQGEECFPAYALGQVRNVRSSGTSNGQSSSSTFKEDIVRSASFNGQSALVQEVSGVTSAGTGVYARNYLGNGDGTTASFGAESLNPANGQLLATSLNDPARVELPRRFEIGASRALVFKVRSTAQGVSGVTDIESTYKLVARENVTVPAGNFSACKFEITVKESSAIAGVTTRTELAGTSWTSPSFGLLKQQTSGTSTVSAFGTNTTTNLTGQLELLGASMGGQTVP
jgi:hypothetical protein